MADIYSSLPYNFFSKKPLEVKFSGLDLSSDAGLLLIRQAEQGQQICQGLTQCLEDQRDPSKIKHTMSQLVSQRIYQIAGGYEDANDSNYLRHDPILKIACDASADSRRRTISQSAHDNSTRKSSHKERTRSDSAIICGKIHSSSSLLLPKRLFSMLMAGMLRLMVISN